MIHINVATNSKKVRAYLSFLSDSAVSTASARALNKTVSTTATAANKEIRLVYNVRAVAIRKAMKIKRAHKKQKSLRAEIVVRGSRIGLIEFQARWTRRMPGTSVKVKVQGPRKTVKGAFIATNSHSGYRGVFRRVGKSRYPIVNLRSISLPFAFFNEAVITATSKVAAEAYAKNYEHELQYILNTRKF